MLQVLSIILINFLQVILVGVLDKFYYSLNKLISNYLTIFKFKISF